jgi:N-acetyl sugar amidotransferase
VIYAKIGRENLDNLKRLGFDTIEISPDINVRRKLNKLCLELVGDISWPEHISIFTIPVQIAIKYKIPLIVWGENPQIEYGGPIRKNEHVLDRKWLEEFGGLLGLREIDLINHYNFNKKDLLHYIYPPENDLKKFKIKGIFLGYYFKWNNYENYKIAKDYGFKPHTKAIEGGYFNFEKIDNLQHGIHDYFKYLKYGFGRGSDQLSFLIRNNLIERKKALKILNRIEGKFPKTYLGIKISKILSKIDITLEDFNSICDQFTNKRIFQCNNKGELIKDFEGNLILKEKL